MARFRSGGSRKEERKYNETISPMKKRKYNYTWIVNAEVKDMLETIRVGDMLVFKMLREESLKEPGVSPEAYLEVMRKEDVEALKARNDNGGGRGRGRSRDDDDGRSESSDDEV